MQIQLETTKGALIDAQNGAKEAESRLNNELIEAKNELCRMKEEEMRLLSMSDDLAAKIGTLFV